MMMMLSSTRSSLLSAARRLQTVVSVAKPCVGLIARNWTEVASSTAFSNNMQVRHRSNRSRRGLYDGKDIRSGNSVSFSMKATKRKFKPNVFKKRVYSEILDDMIQFHMTAAALRSIDKAGGLDNYLLTSRHVTEGEGHRIKKKILKRLKNRERLERKAAEKEANNASETE